MSAAADVIRQAEKAQAHRRALASATIAICQAGVSLKVAGFATDSPELVALRGVIRSIEQRRLEVRP